MSEILKNKKQKRFFFYAAAHATPMIRNDTPKTVGWKYKHYFKSN